MTNRYNSKKPNFGFEFSSLDLWEYNLRLLMCAGLNHEDSIKVNQRVQRKCRTINYSELRKRTLRFLQSSALDRVKQGYIRWERIYRDHIPFSILLIGTTGTGKTAISNELSKFLINPSVLSTDMLREILAKCLRAPEAKLLGSPSYRVWEEVEDGSSNEESVIKAYRQQNALVSIAIDALLRWALDTGRIIVLEGVNIEISNYRKKRDSNIFEFVTVVKSPNKLMQFLKKRYFETPNFWTSITTYEKYFQQIRCIQQFLIEKAKKEDIPIIENRNVEVSARKILKYIEETIDNRVWSKKDE